MIIRFCTSLAAKSASVYDDIQYDEKPGTGILILSSRCRLRDYKNYIKPERGFNKIIVKQKAYVLKVSAVMPLFFRIERCLHEGGPLIEKVL